MSAKILYEIEDQFRKGTCPARLGDRWCIHDKGHGSFYHVSGNGVAWMTDDDETIYDVHAVADGWRSGCRGHEWTDETKLGDTERREVCANCGSERSAPLDLDLDFTPPPCSHDDPDNSGQCIKCDYILDVIDEADRLSNERHPQHKP